MDFGIANKRALVCAASKGLGKAIAVSLAHEGVELFLCARTEDTLKQTANDISQETCRKVHYKTCNLADSLSRESLINAVNKVFPTVDILIHNVGGPKPSTVQNSTAEDWERGFHQNFMSILHLNSAFLPGMKQQRWGRIVTVTSIAVVEPIAGLAVSNGIRAAVTGMMKTLADEVAADGVCVNCVAPGVIHTDRTEERIQHQISQSGGTREDYMQSYVQTIPTGRLGRPEELGDVVCFLCSQQASYITGSTLVVDGGKRKSTY